MSTYLLAEYLDEGVAAGPVNPMPILRAPTTNGPALVEQEAVFVPDTALTIHPRSDPAGAGVELTLSKSRQFRDENSDAGSLGFVMNNLDPQRPLVAEEVVARVWTRGVPAFDGFIEHAQIETIAQGEEVAQVSAFTGRGKVCVTEEGLVYPSYGPGSLPVEDDRTFDWTLVQFNDSGWIPAYELCTVGFAQANWPLTPFATGWHDTSTMVIWAPDGTFMNWSPGGTVFMRQVFTVPTTGKHIFQGVIDDIGTYYMDGVRPPLLEIGPLSEFDSSHDTPVILSAGGHTISGVGTSNDIPGNDTNPGGFAWAIYESDANNQPGALVASSDSSAVILVRPPSQPGMTLGEILFLVFGEAIARGAIPEVALNFSATADSAGTPWPITYGVSTKVGTDLLTFLRELSGTYIDFWMDPGGFWLSATLKNGAGTYRPTASLGPPTDPTLPRSGSVTRLSHERSV